MTRIKKSDVDWKTKSELNRKMVMHAPRGGGYWNGGNPVSYHIARYRVELRDDSNIRTYGNIFVTECGRIFDASDWSYARNAESLVDAVNPQFDGDTKCDKICPKCGGGDVGEYVDVIETQNEWRESQVEKRRRDSELVDSIVGEMVEGARGELHNFVSQMFEAGLFDEDGSQTIIFEKEDNSYRILSGEHQFKLQIVHSTRTGEHFRDFAEKEVARRNALVEQNS